MLRFATRSLDAVLQGKARVGKACLIHDQDVEAFVDRLVDAIDRFPLRWWSRQPAGRSSARCLRWR